MGQASARAEIGEQLVFNFGRAGGFGVVQQKGQRSAGGQAWEEPGVWDNLRAGVGNWRESWTTRGTTLGLPLPSKDLYRYSLIPRGPGSVEPKSTPRAIATCCSLFLRTDNEADKTAREDEASREREKKKRVVLILCGRACVDVWRCSSQAAANVTSWRILTVSASAA